MIAGPVRGVTEHDTANNTVSAETEATLVVGKDIVSHKESTDDPRLSLV